MDKTIGILTMEKMDNRELNSVGSSRIRARWLLPFWEEAEDYVIGKKYDVMIFQKVYWSNMMKAFTGVKILDLCDPDWLEGKPVFEYVDMVDAVTTSTEALAEYVRKIRPDKLVKCIPDRVYLPEATPIHEKHKGPLKKVVWFGYAHNSHYLIKAYDELIKHGIELTAISNNEIDLPLIYRGKMSINNIPYNYDTVNKEIVKADALLMPEPFGDEKSKYKSNNKVIQAWALRMPVIRAPEDLEKLISGEAREEEAAKRRKEVEDKWDVKYSVEEYRLLINKLRAKKNEQR